MSDTVYLLWFVQERDEAKDTELLIGVYAAETDAIAAIPAQNKPGFVDFPHGFQIHRGEIGQDSWTEGFVVV